MASNSSVSSSEVPPGASSAPSQALADSPADVPAGASSAPPGRWGKRSRSQREQLIRDGHIPVDEPPPPPKRKKNSIISELILHGNLNREYLGRPRKTVATGTEMAVAPSQSAWAVEAAKAPKKRNPAAREFLVPSVEVEPRSDSHENDNGDGTHDAGDGSSSSSSDDDLFVPPESASRSTPVRGISLSCEGPSSHPVPSRRRRRFPTPRAATPPGFQPDRQLASKSTAFHQLYFPGELNLQFKANWHAWNDNRGHSDHTVFVLIHQIDDDITDIRVYTSLKDANTDVMKIMSQDHPEAFATHESEAHNDDESVKIKAEEPESAQSIIGQIEPRVRAENDGLPIRNQSGVVPLDMGPEPKYVYWGEWKFTSHCLKMEARMRDSTRVKAFVSLKNMRKPRAG